MTSGIIWNDKIQPKQRRHVACQLTIKISTCVKKKNSSTTVFKTTLRQREQLMVNQKLDYLQFVHSVVQVQKGCPNTRKSSKCKEVIQHGSTWMTSQHLEIIRVNLCSRAYNSDHVLLFWSMSKILIHRYNFPLSF